MAALEGQRATLGDEVVDSLLTSARARLATLRSAVATGGPRQALRQVSILFMDVVGSTTLSQRLDPEEISAVMDGALSRATAIVQANRGRVLQYAGDCVLAAFGADAASEDDAESAVRCGLALLDLGRALEGEVRAAHGHAGFDVRVGVHTGPVLLGGGVDQEGSIRGTSVHIAARLEQSAPPGALQISQDTYGLVRGLFEFESRGPQQMKGLEAPLQSYLVKGAKPKTFRDATRGIEGVVTRMIGRDRELAVLQRAFAELVASPRMACIHVVGDAGVGKSRMLVEFARWLDARSARSLVLRASATPQTSSRPYGLLADLVTRSLQVDEQDPLEVPRVRSSSGPSIRSSSKTNPSEPRRTPICWGTCSGSTGIRARTSRASCKTRNRSRPALSVPLPKCFGACRRKRNVR